MPAFSRLPDHELDLLDDDDLIAYLRAAQRVGDGRAADRALAILVYGHWSNLERRVRLKVPPQHVGLPVCRDGGALTTPPRRRAGSL